MAGPSLPYIIQENQSRRNTVPTRARAAAKRVGVDRPARVRSEHVTECTPAVVEPIAKETLRAAR